MGTVHPPRRAALCEANTKNKTNCSEVKGAADLLKVVNELAGGQKLPMENRPAEAAKSPCRKYQRPARSSWERTNHFTANLQYAAMVAAWMLWLWVKDSHQVVTRATGDLNTSSVKWDSMAVSHTVEGKSSGSKLLKVNTRRFKWLAVPQQSKQNMLPW